MGRRVGNKPAAVQISLQVIQTLTSMFGNASKPDLPALRSTFEAVLIVMKNAAGESSIMPQPKSLPDGDSGEILQPVSVCVKGRRSKTTFGFFYLIGCLRVSSIGSCLGYSFPLF